MLSTAPYKYKVYKILFISVTVVKKTSQFKTVCNDESGYITQLKQQKSKGDITYQHIDIESTS